MTTPDDHLNTMRTEYLDMMRAIIAEHGHAVQAVGSDEHALPFAYTVGLSAHGKPELMLVGLPMEIAQRILNDVAGKDFEGGQEHHDVLTIPVRVRAVGDLHHLSVARAIYGPGVLAWQLVYPDKNGRFPGEEGCDYTPTERFLM